MKTKQSENPVTNVADKGVSELIPLQDFESKPYSLEPASRLRVSRDRDAVERYHQAYRDSGPEALPPLLIVETQVKDGVVPQRYLADGVHRLEAAQAAELTEVPARIVSGDIYKAIQLAVEANHRHGVPWRPADRREAVLWLIYELDQDRNRNSFLKNGPPSLQGLATTLGCSKSTVKRAVDELRKDGLLPGGGQYIAINGRVVSESQGPTRENLEQIAVGLKAGKSNAALAEELGLSQRTVQRYVKKLATPMEAEQEADGKEVAEPEANQAIARANPDAEAGEANSQPIGHHATADFEPDPPIHDKEESLEEGDASDEEETPEEEIDPVVAAVMADFDAAAEEWIPFLAKLSTELRESIAEATILLTKAAAQLPPEHAEAAIDQLQDRLNHASSPNPPESLTKPSEPVLIQAKSHR